MWVIPPEGSVLATVITAPTIRLSPARPPRPFGDPARLLQRRPGGAGRRRPPEGDAHARLVPQRRPRRDLRRPGARPLRGRGAGGGNTPALRSVRRAPASRRRAQRVRRLLRERGH